MTFNQDFIQLMIERQFGIENDFREFESGYIMTDEQQKAMNAALKLEKDKSYRPYCLKDGCDYPRMYVEAAGFTCPHCGNRIDFHLRPRSA